MLFFIISFMIFFPIGYIAGRAYRRHKIMKARVKENNKRFQEAHPELYNKVNRIAPDYNYVNRSKP